MRIINSWAITSPYESFGKPGDVVVIYKDRKSGKRIWETKRPEWYFFVEKNDRNIKAMESAKKIEIIKDYKPGKDYIRVDMDKIQYRDKSVLDTVRAFHTKGIQTFEADLGPSKRYLLDSHATIEDFANINLMYIDIETDDRSGSIEYESDNRGMKSIKAKDRILSICCMDRSGKSYYFTNQTEKYLLLAFNSFLLEKEVDMLVGWNSKDFDMPYIKKRMTVNKINSSYVRNILHEDMMRRVQYFYMKDPEARQSITSYSLESISQYFLKEGKTKFEGLVYDLWSKSPEKLKEYNINDCMLLKKLEDKIGLIELTYQMAQMCKCTAHDWTMIKNLDNFILDEANRQGIHYPTNPSYLKEREENTSDDEAREEYLGAFVLKPEPGYYENVYDLDFKSLYPNIIRTFNISPETYSSEFVSWSIVTPGTEVKDEIRGRACFRSAEGVIPRKITLLLDEREKIRGKQKELDKNSREWKDLNVKQLVIKELANSIYGAIGNPYYRGFNVKVAEAITATGQYLIKHLKEKFEEKGRRVIYGDTDSVFTILKEGENIDDVIKETNRYLSKHLKEEFRVRDCTIQIALDKKLDKFFIEAKKKYIGETDGKTTFIGMECIKRDCIPMAAKMQRDLIKKIFSKKSAEEIGDWLKKNKDSLDNGKIDIEQITIYKKIARSDYKAKEGSTKKYTAPIHVRIAYELKRDSHGKIDHTAAGTILPYLIINSTEGLQGIHLSQYKGEFDKSYYWDKLIYPPLERMLKHVYKEHDWVQYFNPAVIKPRKPRAKKVKEEVTTQEG